MRPVANLIEPITFKCSIVTYVCEPENQNKYYNRSHCASKMLKMLTFAIENN